MRAIADDAPFARRGPGLGRRVVAFALEELREAVVGQVHELAEPQRLADGAHVDVEPVDDGHEAAVLGVVLKTPTRRSDKKHFA